MASLIYNSEVFDAATGEINFDADTFYCLLVTSSYVPNKDTDTKRSDVTNEVIGAGYTADGKPITAIVLNDTANDKTTITFSAVSWATATITAAAAVIYKYRGGAANLDNLVAYVDFGGNVSSTSGTFTFTPSTPLTYQN